MSDDTIFAPATATGRGGIAVIRISGAKAAKALDRMDVQKPADRTMTPRCLSRSGDPRGAR